MIKLEEPYWYLSSSSWDIPWNTEPWLHIWQLADGGCPESVNCSILSENCRAEKSFQIKGTTPCCDNKCKDHPCILYGNIIEPVLRMSSTKHDPLLSKHLFQSFKSIFHCNQSLLSMHLLSNSKRAVRPLPWVACLGQVWLYSWSYCLHEMDNMMRRYIASIMHRIKKVVPALVQ